MANKLHTTKKIKKKYRQWSISTHRELNFFFATALSIIISSSCSDIYKESDAEYLSKNSSDELTFNIIDNCDITTKGTPLSTFSRGDVVGVYAHLWKVDKEPSQRATIVMSNVKLELDSTKWSYSPRQYWSDNINDNYLFNAYAPYKSSNNGITVSCDNGELQLQYVVPTLCSAQPDLMIAEPANGVHEQLVNLNFFHALATISFATKGNSNLRITEISISGVKDSGMLSWNCTDSEPIWSNVAQSQEGEAFHAIVDDKVTNCADTPTNITAKDGYLMMIPQEIPDAGFIVTATITDSFNNKITKDLLISPATNQQEWVAGHHYKYIITLAAEDYTSIELASNSNCYILNPLSNKNRTYTIPLDRIDQFWGDTRYNTDNITGNTLTEIGDDWEVVMIWYDHNGGYTFKKKSGKLGDLSIKPDYENRCIKVLLPSNFYESTYHCNILFGVRKISEPEKILWSWHLWITDYNPYAEAVASGNEFVYNVEGGELHRYDNASFCEGGIYSDKLMLDRNIGARNATELQELGTLYYQYGRKDPFSVEGEYVNDYYLNDYDHTISLATAVMNPFNFVDQINDWCSTSYSDYVWNDSAIAIGCTPVGKSIFDPSPQGFCIPYLEAWNDFQLNSSSIYNGFALFPKAGTLPGDALAVLNCGEVGYYWGIGTSSITYKSNYVRFEGKSASITRNHSRSFGMTIRAVQER